MIDMSTRNNKRNSEANNKASIQNNPATKEQAARAANARHIRPNRSQQPIK